MATKLECGPGLDPHLWGPPKKLPPKKPPGARLRDARPEKRGGASAERTERMRHGHGRTERPLPAHRPWDATRLLERVGAVIQARHLSPRTQKAYVSWIRRYLGHYGMRDPTTLGKAEIEGFLEHLALDLGLGADSQNRAASSIVFMYREIWGIDLGGREGVRPAKPPSVVPRDASASAVDRVLGCMSGAPKVAAMLMYGSGARISEAIGLRIKDISLSSHELRIRAGKGAKDRTTVIARSAVVALRRQIELVEEQHVEDLERGVGWARLPGALHRKDPRAGWELGWQFLFPSTRITIDPKTKRLGRLPVHITTVQRAVKTAVRRSGVAKPITCHVLRHCFATELLRAGCDIRMLQRLMGHRDLKTTARYLHILDRPGLSIVSPLDRLPSQRESAMEAAEDADTGE